MLVEDDKHEVAKAKKKGVDTVYVEEREGITEEQARALIAWSSKA